PHTTSVLRQYHIDFCSVHVLTESYHLSLHDALPILKEFSLKDYSGKKKLISVVPSLDTGICSQQTKRFNEAVSELGDISVLTISMDLPFAQARWCGAEGVDQVDVLSDHRLASFGENYGVLIKELRLLSRAVFVIDEDDVVTYVEYVSEVGEHPDYDTVLEHLKK